MKHVVCSALVFFSLITICTAQETYKQAWEALDKGDRAKAGKILDALVKDKPASADNFITNLYLKSYNGQEATVTDADASFYDRTPNPYPYIYALWFNSGMLGNYGKKKYPHQLRLTDKLIADPKAPGTLVAAAHYQKGMHLLYSNDGDDAQKEFDKVGNTRNWQYVGPFENLSESGFYKEYGPLQHPGPEAVFASNTNAAIKWFAPATEIKDGWTPVSFQINKHTAVAYAQTFVDMPEEKEVYFNTGATGSIKVWLNDQLLLSQDKERTTEMDTYTVK